MRQKPDTLSAAAEKTVRDIKRATRRHFSAEDKIRIVIAGLRGEDSIAEHPVYRVRQGDYRILYSVRPIIIVILDIGHRKDVYR